MRVAMIIRAAQRFILKPIAIINQNESSNAFGDNPRVQCMVSYKLSHIRQLSISCLPDWYYPTERVSTESINWNPLNDIEMKIAERRICR